MKIIRICLMGLVMILSATLNADVRQYHFSHLTMDDGLSHNDITAIIQDAYGFMWFATRDGLNRYDGNKVKVYKSECSPNNSQGINSIFGIISQSAKNKKFMRKVQERGNELATVLISTYLHDLH